MHIPFIVAFFGLIFVAVFHFFLWLHFMDPDR